jgi:hypothetical protein
VALAPLTPILAPDADSAVDQAMSEARADWSEPDTDGVAGLTWMPIGRVRGEVADEDIRDLIAQMTVANDERSGETPSTPPYHRAARELERLAGRVYEASSTGERIAEEAAREREEHIR